MDLKRFWIISSRSFFLSQNKNIKIMSKKRAFIQLNKGPFFNSYSVCDP